VVLSLPSGRRGDRGRSSRGRRGADVDRDCHRGAQTGFGRYDPPPRGGAPIHTPSGDGRQARLKRPWLRLPGDVAGLQAAWEAAIPSLSCQAVVSL
jgi:hypothetical protein